MQETDLDLHEQLMIALNKYFHYNELWEIRKSGRQGINARNALADIRILARKRRMEIQRQRKELKKNGRLNEE